MNLPQETLNTIKSNHPELWRAKAAAGLGDQLIAAAILSQVEQDAKNPPETEALKRIKAAAGIVLVHAGKFRASRTELDRILAEVREQFPELEIEILEEPPGMEGLAMLPTDSGMREVIEKLRVDLQTSTDRTAEVENWLREAQDSARADQEIVVKLTRERAEQDTIIADLTRQRAELDAELKAARELLKQVGACANIKEVRELLKPAEPAQADAAQGG
ncbi:MAG: hypothetical protein WAW39_00810 [Prosthecobacter sp.]|uniref:hypothetical protein n=1 Tax=Prosthecobacter sp. TaxID=1965333 RepID=UPI003BB0F591